MIGLRHPRKALGFVTVTVALEMLAMGVGRATAALESVLLALLADAPAAGAEVAAAHRRLARIRVATRV